MKWGFCIDATQTAPGVILGLIFWQGLKQIS